MFTEFIETSRLRGKDCHEMISASGRALLWALRAEEPAVPTLWPQYSVNQTMKGLGELSASVPASNVQGPGFDP